MLLCFCLGLLLCLQFAIGSVLSLIFWATGFVKPPKLDAKLVSTQIQQQQKQQRQLQPAASNTPHYKR